MRPIKMTPCDSVAHKDCTFCHQYVVLNITRNPLGTFLTEITSDQCCCQPGCATNKTQGLQTSADAVTIYHVPEHGYKLWGRRLRLWDTYCGLSVCVCLKTRGQACS